MTKHRFALALLLGLAGCTAPMEEPTSIGSAQTNVTTDVYGWAMKLQAPVRVAVPLPNEPIQLRPAHVDLGPDGQPTAYANGVPWTVCDGAAALDETTSDAAGSYTFAAVAAGQYCVTARGKDFPFQLDGTLPTKTLERFVIDLNRYGNTCAYTSSVTGEMSTCFTSRDVVGTTCYCQVSLNAYDGGVIVDGG